MSKRNVILLDGGKGLGAQIVRCWQISSQRKAAEPLDQQSIMRTVTCLGSWTAGRCPGASPPSLA